MKKTISVLFIFLLLFLMLTHPILTVNAAARGLLLWYDHILPALLPFAILSDLLIHSGGCFYVSGILHPVIRPFIRCSRQGAFPLLAGLLFGFPMGSRICSQMALSGQISREEAAALFPVCNQISPIFIISYIVHDTLERDELLLPTLLCLYLPAILAGHFLMRNQSVPAQKNTTPGLKMNFSILDAGIMNSFEMICKLGGYIMFFSIMTELLQSFCPTQFLKVVLTAPLEITNGISLIGSAGLPARIRYSCILSLTAFGGICGITQTYSMVHAAGLPMKRYVLIHLLLAGVSGICGYLIYPFF